MPTEYMQKVIPNHPRTSSQGCVPVHVLVAEEMLGRYLTPEEVVHHIDENKRNNNPSNLMVFATAGDHNAFHTGNHDIYKDNDVWRVHKKKDKILTCPTCGKRFRREHTRHKEIMFCSQQCAVRFPGRYVSRNPDGTQEEPGIIASMSEDDVKSVLIECGGNFSDAGRRYNVTPNAFVRYCKRHNMPYHSKDYKTV